MHIQYSFIDELGISRLPSIYSFHGRSYSIDDFVRDLFFSLRKFVWHNCGKVVKSHNAICVRSLLDVVVGVRENYRITEVREIEMLLRRRHKQTSFPCDRLQRDVCSRMLLALTTFCPPIQSHCRPWAGGLKFNIFRRKKIPRTRCMSNFFNGNQCRNYPFRWK